MVSPGTPPAGKLRQGQSKIEVRLDRLQFKCLEAPDLRRLLVPGFTVVCDHSVRPQTRKQTFARVRQYRNAISGTQLFLQYKKQQPWLPPAKVTLIGSDYTGLQGAELRKILHEFPNYQLLLVELAFDFPAPSVVDLAFVRRYGVFGKSRPEVNPRFPELLRYGTRLSKKLIRVYWKRELNSHRVEVEMHSSLLREHQVESIYQLTEFLPGQLPSHLRFVRMDWVRLSVHLYRCDLPVAKILRKAKERSRSIHGLMSYLRNHIGISNPHRLLKDMPLNADVARALNRWTANLSVQIKGQTGKRVPGA
jgi:hypothetical protein